VSSITVESLPWSKLLEFSRIHLNSLCSRVAATTAVNEKIGAETAGGKRSPKVATRTTPPLLGTFSNLYQPLAAFREHVWATANPLPVCGLAQFTGTAFTSGAADPARLDPIEMSKNAPPNRTSVPEAQVDRFGRIPQCMFRLAWPSRLVKGSRVGDCRGLPSQVRSEPPKRGR
jgi:hypothetical protein